MQTLNLNDASRTMSGDVHFVLAIPLLYGCHGLCAGVCGVIYIDSKSANFYLNDEQMLYVVSIANEFLKSLCSLSVAPVERIVNYGFMFSGIDPSELQFPAVEIGKVHSGLEYVRTINPPMLNLDGVGGSAFFLNFEHVDFLPVAA